MKLSDDQLKQIYPQSTTVNRTKYLPYINEYIHLYEMESYDIICAFLAQVGHESGQLIYNEEIASGSAYEGRKDLGNNVKGDGVRFKGRGLIQITGRSNYAEISKDIGVDFVENPELLSSPQYAVLSAFWFWRKRGLNRYCTGKEEDFKSLTKRINGGLNGYSDRVKLWNNAKIALK